MYILFGFVCRQFVRGRSIQQVKDGKSINVGFLSSKKKRLYFFQKYLFIHQYLFHPFQRHLLCRSFLLILEALLIYVYFGMNFCSSSHAEFVFSIAAKPPFFHDIFNFFLEIEKVTRNQVRCIRWLQLDYSAAFSKKIINKNDT